VQKEVAATTFEPGTEPAALKASNALRRVVDRIGRLAAWFIIPLVLVTCLDVVARKLLFRVECVGGNPVGILSSIAMWMGSECGNVQGLQVWLTRYVSKYFDSAFMQELEWHLHTALFTLVLGFGTIYNTHVRVDLIRDTMQFRSKVRLEFAGLVFLMIPYLLLTGYFAWNYMLASYAVGEVSPSAIGLSHRWIIKSFLVAGLLIALVAGIAVLLQVAYILWGDENKRFPLMTLEWPEEAGSTIEGKRRISLDDAPDTAPFVPIPGMGNAASPEPPVAAGSKPAE
jgi:TRAP-type mannitol/chloroaromatic compound transport system permease small subunit